MRENRGLRVSEETRRRRVALTIERVSSPSCRRVLRDYLRWLEEERKLAGSTIRALVAVARALLADWVGAEGACVGAIRRLSPKDVDDLLARRQRQLGVSSLYGFRSGVIRLLQFFRVRGWHSPDFSDRVLNLRAKQPWTAEAPRRRAAGAIARVSSASARRVLRAYVLWLEGVRGLAPPTVEKRIAIAKLILESWLSDETTCVARLRRLGVGDVEELFIRHHDRYRDRGRGQASQRMFQTCLRCFLRFCAAQEWVSADLAASVPSMRSYRLSTVPRGVSEADIPGLVAALPSSSAVAKRDRAIVLLLVTYGVRRAQVAALRLRDLEWRKRSVTFPAHKGGRTVVHVLTPAVAEAIAEYLRDRPPECDVEQVFLRARPSQGGISPGIVTNVVVRLFEAAGVESRPRGPHAFRHAFATRLLAAREPFKTVADLLGHRSLSSTAVYAKVDLGSLREAPLEWPEVLR